MWADQLILIGCRCQGLSNLDWNHALQQLNSVRPRTDEQESISSSDSSTWQFLLHSSDFFDAYIYIINLSYIIYLACLGSCIF